MISSIAITLILAFDFIASLFLTRLIRGYGLRKGIIDIPNRRSSHLAPTVRGGGLAFVLTFLFTILIAMIWKPDDWRLWIALFGGGGVVAWVGWLDDQRDLPALWRFFIHGLAAAWAIYFLGGLPRIDLGIGTVDLGWLGYLLGWFGIVWMLNLYNFMDGIDGLAAGQAVVVSAFAGIFFAVIGNSSLAIVSLALMSSVAGFLWWNWPPAKIFMGDVGSGLLGYTFAVLAIASEVGGGLSLIGWMTIMAVFIVDATVTLLWRLFRRERWFEAHNEHAYQCAVKLGYSHRKVTSTILLLTLCLSGFAFLGRWQPRLMMILLVTALGVLGVFWRYFVDSWRDRSRQVSS